MGIVPSSVSLALLIVVMSSCAMSAQSFGTHHLRSSDINECIMEIHNCPTGARCHNTYDSFSCSCNVGWTGDGTSCANRDECTENTGNCLSSNAICTDTQGSFTCACSTGFSGDGITACTDIDECSNSAVCNSHGTCTNTQGSFSCACDTNYDPPTCSNFNECAANVHNCDAHATCVDTAGSFTCQCNVGYSDLRPSVTENYCQDADECTMSTHNCDSDALCTNTDGSFTCTCKLGYTDIRNGDMSLTEYCQDNNECSSNTNDCDSHASCTNTPGSFTCQCNSGFSGAGTSCSDIDECTLPPPCTAHGTCTNTGGSFACTCYTGYYGDACTDKDECTLDIDNCHAQANCDNIGGSFTCACSAGYSGDGVTCAETGCSDSSREGFTNVETYPNVAGCAASWDGTKNLRAPRSAGNPACGKSSTADTPCASPADACATGWYVCGSTGILTDVTTRLTYTQCNTEADTSPNERYLVALSTDFASCIGTAVLPTEPTECRAEAVSRNEAVCCGLGCGYPDCKRVLYGSNNTKGNINYKEEGTNPPCGATPSPTVVNSSNTAFVGGVLCCKTL